MREGYLKEELLKLPPAKVYELACSGEIKRVPRGFWTEETAIEVMKWLIEYKYQMTEEVLKRQWNHKFFIDNRLQAMVRRIFSSSAYEAINAVYPGRFKPWEFRCVGDYYWTEETLVEAVRWLIDEKLKLTEDEIKYYWSYKFLEQYQLANAVSVFFRGRNLFELLNLAYPNRFKPWELGNVPKGFWNRQTAIEATRWLIETQLKVTPQEARKLGLYRLFKENGVIGALSIFNSSPRAALEAAYPELIEK